MLICLLSFLFSFPPKFAVHILQTPTHCSEAGAQANATRQAVYNADTEVFFLLKNVEYSLRSATIAITRLRSYKALTCLL